MTSLQATFLYQKAAFLLMAKRSEASSSSKHVATDAGGETPTIDASDDEIKEMMK